MLFQSVGAHYSVKTALKHLIKFGGQSSQQALRRALGERYGGEVTLYHKGRAALTAGIELAIGKQEDIKVAVTGLTCYSVPQAVRAAGAMVKYLDINADDLQFSAQELEKALTNDPKIRMMVIQNTLGIPADIKSIEKVARQHKLVIIEDLAHSAGSFYSDGREVGTVGDLVMLSFGKDKALDVVNGGALIIRDRSLGKVVQPDDNPPLAEQLRDKIYPLIGLVSRSLYGVEIGKYILSLAYKTKLAKRSADGEVDTDEAMPGWQAVLALERLEELGDRVKLRRENTRDILDKLSISPVKHAKLPGATLVRVPFLLENRDAIINLLKAEGIHLQDVWYDLPVSPERYYAQADFDEQSCPNAVMISKKLFNIPTHENLTYEHIEKIAEVLESGQVSEQRWPVIADDFEEANFLQSWQWGALHEKCGHKVVHQAVVVEHKVLGGWQGIIKDARRGRYLEVPGGPLIDWTDPAEVERVTRQLRYVAKRNRAAFVRIRPQVIDNPSNRAVFSMAGYRKAPFHLHAEHTNILDLSPSEEDLLAGMRRQTRYEVRQAAKKGVKVSWQTGTQAVEEFYELQQETANRQGFIPSSKDFLSALVESFGDQARIYKAEKDGQLLNMAIVIFHGQEAEYFEAASTPEARQYPGAYGLLWQSIKDAKAMGKTRYNLWGIAYSDDPKHRYAGVTTFKRGFGGQDVTYLPAHDLVINRWRYALNWLIETVRRKKRKL